LNGLITDANVGKGLYLLGFELTKDPVLRGLVRQVVVDELEWDVAIVEELLRLVARWTDRQRIHGDLRRAIGRFLTPSPSEPAHTCLLSTVRFGNKPPTDIDSHRGQRIREVDKECKTSSCHSPRRAFIDRRHSRAAQCGVRSVFKILRYNSRAMISNSVKLYSTEDGVLIEDDGSLLMVGKVSWDSLITRDDLSSYLQEFARSISALPNKALADFHLNAPIGSQEVWAAGVTYFRSRNARMEESKSSGGGDFYDRVYNAARPEIFFKSTAHRVVGPGGKVAIRRDAKWSVPEPELAVLVSPNGKIVGYTIGNDMSSRDIEGENPLYLPQAKVYDRSCALGPGLLVTTKPLPSSTGICLEICRGGQQVFAGSTPLSSMKRDVATLVEYLYRYNSFPNGCFLLTGTGIVPPDSFTLLHGDEIRITIDPIGTLVNVVG